MWSPDNCHNFQSHQFSIVSWKHGLRPEVRSFARLTDLSAMKKRMCNIQSRLWSTISLVVFTRPQNYFSPLVHTTISAHVHVRVTFACKFCTNQFPYFVQFQWFSIWIDFLKKKFTMRSFTWSAAVIRSYFTWWNSIKWPNVMCFFPTPLLCDACCRLKGIRVGVLLISALQFCTDLIREMACHQLR